MDASTTAVVTGAGRGLGLGLVRALRARDVDVIGTVRSLDAADELRSCGAQVAVLDLADAASIETFARDLQRDRVDVLINNGGSDSRGFGGDMASGGALQLPPDVFMAEVATNTLGPMLLTRALAERLGRSDAGRVVNVSSHLGVPEVALNRGFDVGYSASKAALNAVTAMLARALRPAGVIVVAVHPGWVRTDMGGEQAELEPDDVGATMCDAIDRLTPEDAGRLLTAAGDLFVAPSP